MNNGHTNFSLIQETQKNGSASKCFIISVDWSLWLTRLSDSPQLCFSWRFRRKFHARAGTFLGAVFLPLPRLATICCRVYVNCSFWNKFSRSDVLNKWNYIQPQLVWETENNLFDSAVKKKFLLSRDFGGSFFTWKTFLTRKTEGKKVQWEHPQSLACIEPAAERKMNQQLKKITGSASVRNDEENLSHV